MGLCRQRASTESRGICSSFELYQGAASLCLVHQCAPDRLTPPFSRAEHLGFSKTVLSF